MPTSAIIGKDPTKVKHVMECSLKIMHQEYNRSGNQDHKMSYSKLVKFKPRNVLPMTKNKYINCLCEYCVNIELCIDALRSFAKSDRKRFENRNEREGRNVAPEHENNVGTVDDMEVETIIIIDENTAPQHHEDTIFIVNPNNVHDAIIEENQDETPINNTMQHDESNGETRDEALDENISTPRDKFQLSSWTLCEKEDLNLFYKKQCIDRKCEECGTKNLDNKLLPLQRYYNESIKWAAWERTKYKNAAGKESVRTMKVPKEASFDHLYLI